MEGYRAYENDNWQRAADFMWKACIIWDEDGRNVIVYADQPEPYLPRYYLGVALFNLGCYREALHHFEKSLLNQQTIRGTEKQADNLRSLKQKCKEFLEYEEENAEVNCSKWLIDTEEEPAVITEGPREPDQSPDDTH